MAVVAMTREMGALGDDVAVAVATLHGLEVVQHEQVDHHVAEKVEADDGLVHRYLEGESTLLERWKIDTARLSRTTAEEIIEQALRGNVVIRGWGAVSLLRRFPHVLRVRVCAPMSVRIERIMRRLGTTDEARVRREIERRDAAHAGTISRHSGPDWQSPDLYHLVLNTGLVPVEACTGAISQLLRSSVVRETPVSRQVLTDHLLTLRIRGALEHAFGPHHHIDITVENGDAVLSAVRGDQTLLLQASGIARGVKNIERVSIG